MKQKIEYFLKKLTTRYLEDDFPVSAEDEKFRIEIPAGFLMALIKANNDNIALDKLVAIILEKQTAQGYWLEKSYPQADEDIPFFGAVPTCFCIIALAQYYLKENNAGILEAIVLAADYLYATEKKGRFLKASINKSDVINTNLFCAVALLQATKCLPVKSRRAQNFREAAQRALMRSIQSQHFSGGFPYTSFGIKVPYLYHSMSLALLSWLYLEFQENSYIGNSLKAGLKYFKKIINHSSGVVCWSKEKYPEKSGASWIYAWNQIVLKTFFDEAYQDNNLKHLQSLLVSDKYLRNDNQDTSDLFYTAWTVFALSLAIDVRNSRLKTSFISTFFFDRLTGLLKRLFFIIKYLVNWKYQFFNKINWGAIEYW